jgi:uncharacterized protein YqhQ
MKNIGGQAVIEGVMMKSPKGWTVAVRDKKGDIHVKRETLPPLPGLFKLPVLRGVIALYYAMSLGIRALEFSAGKAYEGEAGGKGAEKPLSRTAIGITIGFSIILAVGLFILLPLYATKLVGLVFADVSEKGLLFNLVDGLIRVIVFILYIVIIGLWKEMGRIFEYHGAEHKVIHAYESGKGDGLGMSDIAKFSPLHPRCGTSFLLIVMAISILVFSFIPQPWPFLWKFLSRIILIPLIAGVSYEALKLSAKTKENPLMRIVIVPGLLLQRLTTRQPDEAQLEVALRALEEVLALERQQEEGGDAR